MKFNSAICTTKEQSERLLALGLKKETADMAYRTTGKVVDMGEVRWMYQHNPSVVYKGMMCKEDIPTWSLHRLLMMIDSDVQTDGRYISLPNYGFVKNDNIYDNLCDCIEWLINEGYFNKEYLV